VVVQDSVGVDDICVSVVSVDEASVGVELSCVSATVVTGDSPAPEAVGNCVQIPAIFTQKERRSVSMNQLLLGAFAGLVSELNPVQPPAPRATTVNLEQNPRIAARDFDVDLAGVSLDEDRFVILFVSWLGIARSAESQSSLIGNGQATYTFW
jgi:hypothetical protein